MRLLLTLMTVLAVLTTAAVGLLAFGNGFGDEADKAQALIAELETVRGWSDTGVGELRIMVDGYRISSAGAVLLAVLSLALLVLTFIKRDKTQLAVGLAMMATTVVLIVISPSFETGWSGPVDARTQALMGGVPSILAALSAIGASYLRSTEDALGLGSRWGSRRRSAKQPLDRPR